MRKIYMDKSLFLKIDQETEDRIKEMALARKTTISEFVRRCLNERYEQQQGAA